MNNKNSEITNESNINTENCNEAEAALNLLIEEEKQSNPNDISEASDLNNVDSEVDVDGIIATSNKSVKDLLKHEQGVFIETDKAFLEFLQNFVETQNDKEKQKVILKEQFFWIVMIGFLSLLLTPMILVISLKSLNQITAIVSMVTVFFELVSAIIVLPKIIAKYLFNKKEDEKLLQIIESMQQYNQNKYSHIS